MGFLRRFVCGCGTKSLPLESPSYASCVPSALSPLNDSPNEWAPGRWACDYSSPGGKAKLVEKHADGMCMSEASTELPGAIMESPMSFTAAVLPIRGNEEMLLGGPLMVRANTAPPQARPRVTYFSDKRPTSSGQRQRKPPPPLLMVGGYQPKLEAQAVAVAGQGSDEVPQKPWSH